MICLASDHGGYVYKEKLKGFLNKQNIKFKDFGSFNSERSDAIDFCVPATKEVLRNKTNKGIFICRSGQAVCMIANKFDGARAVCCFNKKSIISGRQHNDANIFTTGADYVSFGKFLQMVKAFLSTEFLGGVYQNRINKLNKLEKQIHKCITAKK